MTVLFRFLVSNAIFQQKTEKITAKLLEQQCIQVRLNATFSNLELPPQFYTLKFPDDREESLVLLFNAGIDPNPAFSGACIARLYRNKANEFCFTYWPFSENSFRTETLLFDVNDLEWEFLSEKKWVKEWPKAKGLVPAMIRLRLWCGIDKKSKKEPNLQFAFILGTQEPVEVK